MNQLHAALTGDMEMARAEWPAAAAKAAERLAGGGDAGPVEFLALLAAEMQGEEGDGCARLPADLASLMGAWALGAPAAGSHEGEAAPAEGKGDGRCPAPPAGPASPECAQVMLPSAVRMQHTLPTGEGRPPDRTVPEAGESAEHRLGSFARKEWSRAGEASDSKTVRSAVQEIEAAEDGPAPVRRRRATRQPGQPGTVGRRTDPGAGEGESGRGRTRGRIPDSQPSPRNLPTPSNGAGERMTEDHRVPGELRAVHAGRRDQTRTQNRGIRSMHRPGPGTADPESDPVQPGAVPSGRSTARATVGGMRDVRPAAPPEGTDAEAAGSDDDPVHIRRRPPAAGESEPAVETPATEESVRSPADSPRSPRTARDFTDTDTAARSRTTGTERSESTAVRVQVRDGDGGSVTLRLRLEGDNLSGRLQVQNPQLLRELSDNIEELRGHLHGMGYESVDLNLGSRRGDQGHGPPELEEWDGSRAAPAAVHAGDDGAPRPAGGAAGSLDVLV